MKKILLTTDNFPVDLVVKKVFGMIQITGTVQVSKKASSKVLWSETEMSIRKL